jgi:hypothetical protein
MPSFKHKTNKKIVMDEKSIVTLDSKHKELENEFNIEATEVLPNLRAKRKYLNKILEEQASTLSIEQKLEIEDSLRDIKEQINASKKSKKQYYLNNNKHIFEYFENKKNISMNNSKTKILNTFFKIKGEEDEEQTSHIKDNVQKYLSNLDESFIDVNKFVISTDICQYCRKGELIPIDHEGIMVCNQCHKHVQYLVENEKPSYKEPPKEACFYAYKRINHFREILAQFQAKETTQIPEEVLENIKNQIRKERIELSQLNNKKAKDILKKLGYNKFYEHIPFIKDKLGIKPPVMTQELEESLCNLFMEIQGPYAKFCPDDRVNFLNYYYTVYKLCELLDQTQFLPYFPMLKDREKRIEQDEIWKKICQELDWEFIPTI